MALWAGLGQASTAAQLVGADVSGLISMIIQAVLTARHNRFECEQLAHRVLMIAQLLPNVKEPEAAQPLAGLDSTLRRAHELVVSCQERSAAYQFFMASRTAERFREVESKIDSYLILFPVISYIGITRRLERIYNVLVPEESTGGEPSTLAQLQVDTEVVQEILQQGTKEFTFAEIQVATNNFAENNLISEGRFGTVFRGRLQGGRLVAIQSMSLVYRNNIYLKQFHTQLSVLARLRHKHIVRLLGSYVNKDMRLLTNLQKIKNHLLTWWRKETNEKTKNLEAQIVYEYMENGSLFDHLHRDQGSSMLSPVIVSWKMRIDVLLGVSRAIEHLHCHANPPIIHEDISSGNILFDVSWVPHVSDFGFPVVWAMGNEMMASNAVKGTLGYVDPEYYHTGRMQTTNDVYSLGVVMLEVLTGQKPVIVEETRILNLVSSAIPIIELGNMRELLDRRPVPEPTPGQLKALEALEHVAQTARCCVKLNGKDRPTISDIVANLEMTHELISRDDPSSVDELPNSPRASSVSSSCYYSDLGVDTDL